MPRLRGNERKLQILECACTLLEDKYQSHLTTQALAQIVGVSEAALYKHFPSKTKIFEALLDQIECELFSQFRNKEQVVRGHTNFTHHILTQTLLYFTRHPGKTRLITGEVLIGESERLMAKRNELMSRIESYIKTSLNDDVLQQIAPASVTLTMMELLEGKASRFTRSGFKILPLENWDMQWRGIKAQLSEPAISSEQKLPGARQPLGTA